MKQLLVTIAALVLVGCGPQPPDISIHQSATEGNIEVVKQHLAAGVDVNAKNKIYESTPLHGAAVNGHKEIAELLIAKGADVNAKNDLGDTPLHMAAFDQKEVAEMLIAEGADVNARKDGGKTPLDEAINNGQIVIIALLRKHGGKTGAELKAEGK